MVKQSTPLTAAQGNRAPDAPEHFANTEFARMLCAMDDLSIVSASAPSSVAGSRGTTPIVSRGTTPIVSRGTTPIVSRNRTRGPIRTPSPTPRGRLASAAASATTVASGVASAAAAATTAVTGLFGRTPRADQSQIEAACARADAVLARVDADNATPRPRADPLPMLPEESPAAVLYAAADANAAGTRARTVRGVPPLNVAAAMASERPITASSNPFEEDLQTSMRVMNETIRTSNNMGAAGASAPPVSHDRFETRLCTICYERFNDGDDVVKLECDNVNGVPHCFHRDCLKGLSATYKTQGCTTYPCPLCRHSHDISDLHTPAAVEQQTRPGLVQRMWNGVGRMTGRGETPAPNDGSTWSEVAAGAMGVLAGEAGQVFPQSSTTSFDPENGLSIAGSSTARSVGSEESYDPEQQVETHEEFLDLHGGKVHCKNCWNGYNCHLKELECSYRARHQVMSSFGKSNSVTNSAQPPVFSKEIWLYRLPTFLLALSWTIWCGLMVDYFKRWNLMSNWIWLATGAVVLGFMYHKVVPLAYFYTPNVCKLIYQGIRRKHKSKGWIAIEYTVRTVAFLVLVTVIISTIVTPLSLAYFRYLNYLYVKPVLTWAQYATQECVVYYIPFPVMPPTCLWATMVTHFFLEKTPLRDLQMILEGWWEGYGLKQILRVYFGFLPYV